MVINKQAPILLRLLAVDDV